MMDFDMSWKEPTEAQAAALKYVCQQFGSPDYEAFLKKAHYLVLNKAADRAYAVDADVFTGPQFGFDVFDYAELILTADRSLWYTQACGWTKDEVPDDIRNRLKKVGPIFITAGQFVKNIVDWGYQDGVWWDMDKIYPDPGTRALYFVSLIEAVRLIDTANTPRSGFDTMMRALSDDFGIVLSQGFRKLPDLIMPKISIRKLTRLLSKAKEAVDTVAAIGYVRASYDKAFRKVWNAGIRKAKAEASETYQPARCIRPGCENLVAPSGIKPREGHHKSYRGTGACRAGHNSYYCTKCEGPHSFATKVGKAHLEEYYGGDWTAETKEKIGWKSR